MVARIKTGKSLRRALSYNERKLGQGVAELILASGFPVDEGLLGFSAKMKRFETLINRNPNVATNAVHISLNFPPEEKLSVDTLQRISMDYMERIGFHGQPFLVYRHLDSNHPHVHIVTTNLRYKGRPINLHNLAKLKSEPARKALELDFGLIRADSRATRYGARTSIAPWSVNYGKEETKHAITNIVGEIVNSYKFGNLEELNVILGQYRITAHRGSVGSRMYRAGGLVYSLLGAEGNRIGIPIKASSIHGTPTLKNLEKRFAAGNLKKLPVLPIVFNVVNRCLKNNRSGKTPLAILAENDIGLVIKRDRGGEMSVVHFVDHRRKAVFSSQELGLQLKDIQAFWSEPTPKTISQKEESARKRTYVNETHLDHITIPVSTLNLIGSLLSSHSEAPAGPDDQQPRRKKKRKGPSL